VGKYLVLHVGHGRAERPRAKYFPVRPNLTQSISILSYDPTKPLFPMALLRARKSGNTAFSRPAYTITSRPHNMAFSNGFIIRARVGKYMCMGAGHMINSSNMYSFELQHS